MQFRPGLLLALLLGPTLLFATLTTGEAQQAAKVPQIGFLQADSTSTPGMPSRNGAFRHGLRELGYVEGQNIAIEFRWADGKYDRLPALAAELVRLTVARPGTLGPGHTGALRVNHAL